jgi:DNA polymerase-3 subunit delta
MARRSDTIADVAALEPAYLIHGTDRVKIRAALAKLKTKFSEDAIEQWQAATHSAEEVLDACNRLGLLADQRLHIVHSVDAWKADDVSQLVDYLAAPSPDAVLVLLADALRSNSRLLKAFEKPRLIEAGGPANVKAAAAWVVKAFESQGAHIDAAAATRLVEICGVDDQRGKKVTFNLDRLTTDVDRIAAWAGGDTVTVSDVENLATTHVEQKVWALTDAWASRNRAQFVQLTEQLLAQKEHPVRLTGVVGRHLRTVHDARRQLSAGALPGMVSEQLVASGTNRWSADKIVEQASRVNLPQVDGALARVAQLDAELKGASALSSGKLADGRDAARIVCERGLLELL